MTEQFQHFLEEVKESFWGDLYRRTRPGSSSCSQCHCRSATDTWAWRITSGWESGSIATGFTPGSLPRCSGGADAEAEFSAEGSGAFPTAGAGSNDVDPRSVSARLVDAAGGASGGRRDSVASDAQPGPAGAGVSSSEKDEWAYLFLDGVSLRVRRPSGRKRVQMSVAYGVRQDGSRQLLAFLRSQGDSQAAREGSCRTSIGAGWKGRTCC